MPDQSPKKQSLTQEEAERMTSLLKGAKAAVGKLPPSKIVKAWQIRWEVFKHSCFEVQDGQVKERPAFIAYRELWALRNQDALRGNPGEIISHSLRLMLEIHSGLGVLKKENMGQDQRLLDALAVLDSTKWKVNTLYYTELVGALALLALGSIHEGQARVSVRGLEHIWNDYPACGRAIDGSSMNRYLRETSPKYHSDMVIQDAVFHLKSLHSLAEQASFVHPVLALSVLEVLESEAVRYRKEAEARVIEDFGKLRKSQPLNQSEREAIRELCHLKVHACDEEETSDKERRNSSAYRLRNDMLLPGEPITRDKVVSLCCDFIASIERPENVKHDAERELLDSDDTLKI